MQRSDPVHPELNSGKLITIEGGEGAGKSTQAGRLQEWLGRKGIEALLTREPGGTVEAEEIRRLLIDGPTDRWDPLTETLLHFAARRVHLDRVILPAIRQGKWVVCDRFADSTMAYQGYGLELEPTVIAGIYALVIGDFAPDLTIILDMPIEAAFKRLEQRGGRLDRYEQRDQAFHLRVREGFRSIAVKEPERCHVLDAGQEVDNLAFAIERLVAEQLATSTLA